MKLQYKQAEHDEAVKIFGKDIDFDEEFINIVVHKNSSLSKRHRNNIEEFIHEMNPILFYLIKGNISIIEESRDLIEGHYEEHGINDIDAYQKFLIDKYELSIKH